MALLTELKYKAPVNNALPSLSNAGLDDFDPRYRSSKESYDDAAALALAEALLACVVAVEADVLALLADVDALEADVLAALALDDAALAEEAAALAEEVAEAASTISPHLATSALLEIGCVPVEV